MTMRPAPPRVASIRTLAPSASESSSSSRLRSVSTPFPRPRFLRRAAGLANDCASRSVSRTESSSATTLAANEACCAAGSASKARVPHVELAGEQVRLHRRRAGEAQQVRDRAAGASDRLRGASCEAELTGSPLETLRLLREWLRSSRWMFPICAERQRAPVRHGPNQRGISFTLLRARRRASAARPPRSRKARSRSAARGSVARRPAP